MVRKRQGVSRSPSNTLKRRRPVQRVGEEEETLTDLLELSDGLVRDVPRHRGAAGI